MFFKPWAYAFCQTPKELSLAVKKAVEDKEVDKMKVEQIRDISYINPQGAFNYAAEKIIELYYSRIKQINSSNT